MLPGLKPKPHLDTIPLYVPPSVTPSVLWPSPVMFPNTTGGLPFSNNAIAPYAGCSIRQEVRPLAPVPAGRMLSFIMTSSCKIDHISFGIQAHDYNTTAVPQEVTFNGASGFGSPLYSYGQSAEKLVSTNSQYDRRMAFRGSDWITSPVAIDSDDVLVVIFDISAAANQPAAPSGYLNGIRQTSVAESRSWYQPGASYNIAAPTGTWQLAIAPTQGGAGIDTYATPNAFFFLGEIDML
jgi:hypothetical protein